ncbi:hypothetical protein LSAT2_022727 [Lamellibrachia satsuma]|nr:hypothetical protein LSAT2_022727 [Lamellibrachia satsuma]
MKEIEVELEELRLLVVAMVGREQGSCASSSGEGTVDDKVGKDTRDARESSPQPGRKLRGGKVTGHRETGRKETGRKGTGGKTTGVKERGVGETGGKKGVGETGGKTTGVKERGVAETGGKEKGVGETGGKTTGVKDRGVGETGGKEKGVGETEGKGSGQNVMEGIERKSYSAAVIEGVRKRARVFVGDSIVRKTDRVLNKGDDVVVCLPGAKIEAITERVKNIVGSAPGRVFLRRLIDMSRAAGEPNIVSSDVSVKETMCAIIIYVFACLALAALADDNVGQLEKTDEDYSENALEVSDEVAGRSKRDDDPLLAIRRRTRRHAEDCDVPCRKGSCSCRGKSCRCWCTWWGRPKCKAKGHDEHSCSAKCKKSKCDVSGKCVKCRCSLWRKGYCSICSH